MARGVALLVGTKKGLYIFRSSGARSRWKREGPHFPGEPVYHAVFDARDGRSLYAACNWTWGGPKIRVSRDLGKTWTVTANPAFRPDAVVKVFQHVKDPVTGEWTSKATTTTLSFKRTWHIEPGHPAQPNVVWAGVEPAALFRSDDRGESWQEVTALTEHPSREKWEPGGGGLGLHSIALDPADPRRLTIAISAGGAFETSDGGGSWRPANAGTRADFLPGAASPEVGQCVHHLVAHPTAPGVRFQQNHCGVYWREDGDARWQDRSAGLPSEYGFAAAIHPHDSETAYVIPLESKLRHAAPPGIAVYRTRDRGKTWARLARGLPRGASLEVMREGLTADRLDPVGLYFGATNGEVWASRDEGRAWEQVAAYLPPVLSVTAVTIG